jgi:aspartyl-tRNA(Asn)/glutamyl-tRNA(Gln) amidotransferase subunit A
VPTLLPSLFDIASELALGRATSRGLTEACLARIRDESGEGARAFTHVYSEAALAAADGADLLQKAGVSLSPLAGIPVSVKDLFDVAGEVTLAGSIALRDAPAARADAEVVARLRRAGAVIVGKTNMTEFAFSGLGINPHYGTPKNPWERAVGRIPGGSSSGAAVSVTDRMAAFAIGTDTGGSVRIPAALCGVVGFKPTARRVPLDGCYPLARSLDSIGPLAPSVACCALIDGVLSGAALDIPTPLPISDLRLGVPKQYVLEGLDAEVARAFAASLAKLSSAGARIVDVDFPELLELPAIHKDGGLPVMEAYAMHRRIISDHEEEYDPRVASRILGGRSLGAADYIDVLERRAAFVQTAQRRLLSVDALAMPAASLIAPTIGELEASDAAYFRANSRALRNTSVVNFFDGCALSIPCHETGGAPVGFMIAGPSAADRHILAVGLAIEGVLMAKA